MHTSQLIDRPSESIVRAIAQSAALSDRAILVGNRAGIVEWTNEAWTQLTGFPIEETVAKPISHFLEQARFELELVDFVGQHFREGRSCEIEFPFETFDERTIWVHLEVQPIRNETGEISDFVAIATDATERNSREVAAPETPFGDEENAAALSTGESRDRLPNIQRVSTSAIAEIGAEPFFRRKGPRTHFDVCLGHHLPSIRTNRILLEELVSLLLESAFIDIDESWGFVSLTTGRMPAERRFLSAVHGMPAILPAIDASAATSPETPRRPLFQYVEVHDTGATLSKAALEAIRLGVRLEDPRTQILATATALASTLGASLLVDSTPGCGTQALLLLPDSP